MKKGNKFEDILYGYYHKSVLQTIIKKIIIIDMML